MGQFAHNLLPFGAHLMLATPEELAAMEPAEREAIERLIAAPTPEPLPTPSESVDLL